MIKRRRFSSYKKGLWAEFLACLVLGLKGYRVVATRFRSSVGEIDIVAARGGVLALVEVKARDSRQSAMDAVTPRQQARQVRAAGAFLVSHPQFSRHSIRFDVMLVLPWRWPEHIKGAWEGAA